MRKGYQRGIALIIVIMLFLITGCGTESGWLKKSSREENESRSDFGFQKENPLSSLAAKDEERAEEEDLQTINTVLSAFTTAIADAKATGTGIITIDSESTLKQAETDGKDTQRVLDTMVEVLGDGEIKLKSDVGKGRELICYYETSKNLVEVYVAQHDDSVGGSEISPHSNSGVVVQNCKYHDNTPLMAANYSL